MAIQCIAANPDKSKLQGRLLSFQSGGGKELQPIEVKKEMEFPSL